MMWPGRFSRGKGPNRPSWATSQRSRRCRFPAVICASVNDAALHGIPGRRRLAAGDLVSIDCGAILDGWVADAATSFTVGPPGADDKRLIGAAAAALRAGIGAAVAGARI